VRDSLSQSTSSFFDQMSSPLPEEAVGVGARWEVRQATATSVSGMAVFQKVVYELTAVDGPSLALRVTTELTAPRQTVSGLSSGMDAQVESYAGNGTGTVSMRLDSLAPTADLTVKMSNVMSVGGGTQSIRTATMRMTLKPGK
jgi:hypothetical protein